MIPFLFSKNRLHHLQGMLPVADRVSPVRGSAYRPSGLPCFHAVFPGRCLRRCMRTFLNSSPISPRRRRKTRMSYFALSAQKGRWFFVLAHFAFLARAAMARQRIREGYNYSEMVAAESFAFRLAYLPESFRHTILEKFR